MRLRLLAATLLLMLSGCVSPPNPLEMPFDDPEAAYIVVGMQLAPNGNEWPRWANFELYQVDGNVSISLGYRRDRDDKFDAIAVKPGEYEIRNVRINLNGDKTIFSRQRFAVGFQAEAGKAYHLGAYRILCQNAAKFPARRPVCSFFRNPPDLALNASILQRYPQIKEVLEAKLKNFDSAYPVIRLDPSDLVRRLQEIGALPALDPQE